MEVFASSKMGPYMSKLLRNMLAARLIRKQIFNSIWEVYESSSVLTTDGSKSPCNQLPMSIGIKGLCKNRTKWKKAKAK
uniref:Uncharacterized protein n=1 Tax=Setaria italica TaxID=4555 RepID=K3YBB6_SETIT